jgi:hypothetical protein
MDLAAIHVPASPSPAAKADTRATAGKLRANAAAPMRPTTNITMATEWIGVLTAILGTVILRLLP